MKKTILTHKYLSTLKLLKINDFTITYLTKEGDIVKLFKPEILEMYHAINYQLEEKILNEDHYYISNEITKPLEAFYSLKGCFIGYKMRQAKGIDFNAFDDTLTPNEKFDLSFYNDIHRNLENIVKKNKVIVFPDLCSCDNIYIDRSNNSIELIDPDGMQIGRYQAAQISSTLDEDSNDYYIPKYWNNELFNKNLDKKSLIMLYFLDTFHANLNSVGIYNPFEKKHVTLEYFFDIINLTDYEIQEKVQKIFDDDQDNEYLEDSIEKLEKDYKLTIASTLPNGHYIKKLQKKS